MKQTLIDTQARLGLNQAQMAVYLGVPAHTYRKWHSGERAPAAVVARLLHVLGTVEALNPALHAHFIPDKG